jgi:hypothetical protein
VAGQFGTPAHLRKIVRPAAASFPAAAAPSLAPATPLRAAATPSPAQVRCDGIQQEFRATGERRSIRHGPPPLPAALVPTGDPLSLRLAEELEYARRLLDQMGESLSSDPIVIARHLTDLQAVDIIGQIIGHIANIVRSSDPAGAVERIGMADLKGRLKRLSIA